MDKKGIGKVTGGIIALSSLATFGYCMTMLAAAEAESDLLHYLSYILIIPSFIAIVVIMILNWHKSVKYFVTFEEITKNYLDSYFAKINKEKYSLRGLEWATAQLGHFWIELRIKQPSTFEPEVDQSKEKAFIQSDAFTKKNYSKFQRQESKENHLDDREDQEEQQMLKVNSNRQSEISGLYEHCDDPN